MYRTVQKAEEAALSGEGGEDLDTQQCWDLQAEVMSSPTRSSPNRGIAAVATSKLKNDDNASNDQPTIVSELAAHITEQLHARRSVVEDSEGGSVQEHLPLPPTAIPSQQPDVGIARPKKPFVYQRDSQGRARLIAADGQSLHQQNPDFSQRQDAVLRKTMDDYHEPSSLTPTQANSDSLYLQFESQNEIPKQNPSTAEEVTNNEESDAVQERGRTQVVVPSKQQHHSAVTDSTTYTYGENDTGHVDLVFPEGRDEEEEGEREGGAEDDNFEAELELDEQPSQDASFSKPHAYDQMPLFEPLTPAPALNPFTRKGSVMKGHEMFGATQPSSIGRHINSPTSSRPSPDVYNNSSPQKPIMTSPLADRGDETALQSSVRNMLRSKSESADTPTKVDFVQTSSRSFGSRREPQDVYVSVEESQERRKRAALSPTSNVSDSETESANTRDLNRRRLEQNQVRIQEQFAKVTTSRPGAGFSAEVEVPSTEQRRRRSAHEQHLAQCGRVDGRNTQQEDVVIDSQPLVEEPEELDNISTQALSEVELADQQLTGSCLRSSPPPANMTVTQVSQIDVDYLPRPRGLGSPAQQASLPLQEVSTNRPDLRTPAAKSQVFSDPEDATIRETSPPDPGSLQPIGNIASFSSTPASNLIQDDVPGFTQDDDFENAIRPPVSPTPPRPRSKVDKFPSFDRHTTPVDPGASETLLRKPQQTTPSSAAVYDTESALAKPAFATSLVSKFSKAADTTEVTPTVELQADQAVVQATSEEKAAESAEIVEPEAETEYENEGKGEVTSTTVKQLAAPVKRSGLRSREELKGPSRSLRRCDAVSTPSAPALLIDQQIKTSSAKSSKHTPIISSTSSTPLSSVGTTPSMTARSSRKTTSASKAPTSKTSANGSAPQAHFAKEETPVPVLPRNSRRSMFSLEQANTPMTIAPKQSMKRKSAVALNADDSAITRSSKRQSTAQVVRASSDDPLVVPTSTIKAIPITKPGYLFQNMAFAVSYSNKNDKEKGEVSALIIDRGARIFEDGFDRLFDSTSPLKSRNHAEDDTSLTMSGFAESLGFVALISDEHSRKTKYMQALALGIPCLSGRWVSTCVAKGEVVEWAPYLLCAGQSSFLDNAVRSRILTPYVAAEAKFSDTFASREKLLKGKSILLVTGTGKVEETRRAYVFLTRALGPVRILQVPDLQHARRKLLEDESWDLLYVDKNEATAEKAVFGTGRIGSNSGATKKRKRVTTTAIETIPIPKKIRVISDEVMMQSLIFGQLLEV